VNADGTVVVGIGDATGITICEAFRWTQAGGMAGLGFLTGGTFSQALGVNADGTVVVGLGDATGIGEEAFRSTQAGGMAALGFQTGGTFSEAHAVNADGTVVVGIGDATGIVNEAFRWTQAGGMAGLGLLPGGTFSSAQGVNADGTVVVGYGDATGIGSEAFRWTQAGGMAGLGLLPGGTFGTPSAVNADGTVVVGYGNATGIGEEAFCSTQAGGMQTVQALLTAKGVSTTGWTLTVASGVSADGQVIVGFGTDPSGRQEGWIANLGPSTVTFAAFSAQLQLDVNANPAKDALALETSFTLGMKAPAINPLIQAVTSQVGPYSATIPAGKFKQSGPLFTYAGTISGVNVQAVITPTGTMRYAFAAAAEHPDLTRIAKNPVPVKLTIGSDTGTKSVTAIIYH
jgi:probable HAF family extracellular repeat protein